jgi:tRNA(Ile)-lysidine synthase
LKKNPSKEVAKATSIELFEEAVVNCLVWLISEQHEQIDFRSRFSQESHPQREKKGSKQNIAKSKILIALSGGVDSTALISSLAQTRNVHNLDLHAAHFNHGLRGPESLEDEEYCKRLCSELSIPIHCGCDETNQKEWGASKGNPISEAALRERRYKFLEETAVSLNANTILTGHNLDDQSETILFRLLRGTSLAGMKGMQAVHQLNPSLWLLRPLLGIPRAEIERYVLARQITSRQDSSNNDTKYSRNFIRHQIMPLIKERFPQVLERIENLACTAAIDEDYLNSIALRIYAEHNLEATIWPLDTLRGQHQAILDRLIAIALKERAIEVDSDTIEAIRKQIDRDNFDSSVLTNRRFSLNKTWDLVHERSQLRWLDKTIFEQCPTQFSIRIRIPGSTPLLCLNKAIRVEVYEAASTTPPEGAARMYGPKKATSHDVSHSTCDRGPEVMVDLDSISEPLIMRRRRPGDQIQPAGKPTTTSLKKYLHRKKAAQLEDSLRLDIEPNWSPTHCPVLVSGDEVVWVPGVGLSEKLRVKDGGKPSHLLKWLELGSPEVSVC